MLALIAIAAIVIVPVLLLIGDTLRLGQKEDPLAGAPHGPRREKDPQPEALPVFVERRSDTQLPFVGSDRRQALAASAGRRPIAVPAEIQQEQLDALLASMNAVRSQPLAPAAEAS